MFERFTAQARRALVLAQEAARVLRHDSIDTGVVLIGLVMAESGLARDALVSLGIDAAALQRRVAALRPPTVDQPIEGHIRFAPEAKKALELALRESLERRHRNITTGHLLLGCLHVPDSLAVKAFADVDAVRAAVRSLLDAGLDAELSDNDDQIKELLTQSSGWSWPPRRSPLSGFLTTIAWYLATAALIVWATWNTAGPELVIALILAALALSVISILLTRFGRAAVARLNKRAPSSIDTPGALSELMSRYGISDLQIRIWRKARSPAASRVGRRAWIVLPPDAIDAPTRYRFALAHEIGHLIRNDNSKLRLGWLLMWNLLIPGGLSFTPLAWLITAVSLVLYYMVAHWSCELDADRIGVRAIGHQDMISFIEALPPAKLWQFWRLLNHPPTWLRLRLAQRA